MLAQSELHLTLLCPFFCLLCQPLQLSTIKCPGGSSATRDRAKRHRPDNTHDKDATLFRVGFISHCYML
jgi:hypothetical protein